MSEAEIERALEAARRTGAPRVVVKVDAAWCGMCADLDRQVLSAPAGRRALGGALVLRLDFDAEESAGPVERLAILELPTVVVLRPDGLETGRVVGYGDPSAWLRAFGEALARDADPVASLRARVEEAPEDRRAALALAEALLSRAPAEGEARLEALAFGDDHEAAVALHLLGRYRQRARRDPASARGAWRELSLRFPDHGLATGALTWYARAQASLGQGSLGSRAFAERHAARPRDAALVRAWARFVGRALLEAERERVRAAALSVLAGARGADRDDLERLVLELGRPLSAGSSFG